MVWFAATAHQGCPFYGQNYVIAHNVSSLAWGTDFYGRENPEQAEYQTHYRERMKADQHFDRRCKQCGYSWIETKAAAE